MAAYIVETSRVFARRVAEVEPMWIESAARHLSKREFLEPDWDEAREQVVARERISFLGLTLSANRIVNYGPIDPEASRLIFAREALVYRRLAQRPQWLAANDAAIRAAERLEERLRARNLMQPPEFFVEFYAARLPRQVSSGATLEHFTRHLSAADTQALTLLPEQIFARVPDEKVLAQFPESVALDSVSVPVTYRFAPGEHGDGATLSVPLILVPVLTRSMVDAAVPGFVEPHVEALLRSLPKDARRSLIPIAAAAAHFLSVEGAPSTDVAALKRWLQEVRGVPAQSLNFDLSQVPADLTPRVAVFADGGELCAGSDIAALRRRCAHEARRELVRCARLAYPGSWRRFEAQELPGNRRARARPGIAARVSHARSRAPCARGALRVERGGGGKPLAVGRRASCALHAGDPRAGSLEDARGERPAVVERGSLFHARGIARHHFASDVQARLLWRCRRAEDSSGVRVGARSRAWRASFEPGSVTEAVGAWLAQARAVRRLLDDPRARAHAEAAAETRTHLESLLRPHFLGSMSADWLRQVPRYLRAEERRWQRIFARGGEPAQILEELREWSGRHRALQDQVSAELRRMPELDDLRLWIEEYRVSLYAQELKTLGPSAARLGQRAAQITAWLAR